jgi:hypothetical protein
MTFQFGATTICQLALALTLSTSVFAQATRTWVSGVGDDANPCSRTAPCKTLQGTISKTAANGEIDILDPGGFGAVTITKSMTIVGLPFTTGVLVSGTNGVIVNAGANPVNVTLRGIDFNGVGTALSAVKVFGTGQVNLHLENSVIYGFNNGVEVTNGVPTANVTISNSRISECNAGGNGVLVDGTAAATGGVNLSLINSEVHNCAIGVSIANGARVDVRSSDLSQNTTAVNLAGATSVGLLDSNSISFCTTAVNVATVGGIVRLSNNTISDNTTGLATISGGVIQSYSNNRLKGNTTNGAPTATVVQN